MSKADHKASVVRIKADYKADKAACKAQAGNAKDICKEVAKERCDELAGNGKDVCMQEAKAVEKKALAIANMSEDIGEAKKDAAADKLNADYKVALEKCNALAGDTKTRCVAAAKSRFGKN